MTISNGTLNRVVDLAKRNPEGLLLLAAGCALLMRSGSGPSRHGAAPGLDEDTGPSAFGRAAEKMSGFIDDVTAQVSERTHTLAGNAQGYAASTGATIADRSRQTMQDVKEKAAQVQERVTATVNDVLREQPLAVAVAGLAAGAALAAIFPPGGLEQRTIGPAVDRAAEVAARAGGQLKEAAVRAGKKAATSADEHGFNRENLEDVADEVAEEFTDALSGKSSAAPRQNAGRRPNGGPPGTH